VRKNQNTRHPKTGRQSCSDRNRAIITVHGYTPWADGDRAGAPEADSRAGHRAAGARTTARQPIEADQYIAN
jgi:hypothetical protein